MSVENIHPCPPGAGTGVDGGASAGACSGSGAGSSACVGAGANAGVGAGSGAGVWSPGHAPVLPLPAGHSQGQDHRLR